MPLVGDGPFCSQLTLLWYSLSSLFSEQAWQYLRLELLMGKFSLSLSLSSFIYLFFSSLAIPGFGLLSHVSSLRVPSGHSGLVLTLSSAAHAFLFSRSLLVADASIWATSPLGVAFQCVICGFYLFIFSSRLCCPLRFQNSPQTRWWKGFLVFRNFSFTTPSPGRVSVSNSFVSLFLLYFVLPPFEENGMPFWVAGVLRQHSEVVLWNLFSIQVIFRWICGAESSLTILFHHHLPALLYLSIILNLQRTLTIL